MSLPRVRTAVPHALRAAVLIGFFTVAVKIAGMARDILLASEFGTGDEIEAFLAALVIPQFLAVIMGNSLEGLIIPLRADARARGGEDEARRFSREMLLASGAVLLVITLLLVPARTLLLPLVTASFSDEKAELAGRLWLITLPGFFFAAMASAGQALLNTRDRFGLAALAPVTVSIATIAALLLFPSAGIEAAAVGFVAGLVVQGGILLFGMRRAGLDLLPRWYGGVTETRTALRRTLPFLANGVMFASLGVVDQAMAATLGPGNIAILNYGNKLVLPLLGIGSASLATALYPAFSRMVAGQEWQQLRRTARRYATLTLVLTIPLTITMVALSPWIVSLVFERGAFSSDDSAAVARVQAIYALMIPIYTVAQLFSRIIYAIGALKFMAISSAGIFAFNVIADYVFKEWIGIEGIAVATVLNFFISLLVNIYLVRRLINDRAEKAARGAV